MQVRGTVAGAPTATTFVIGRKTVDFSRYAGRPPRRSRLRIVRGGQGDLDGSPTIPFLQRPSTLEDATGGQPSGDRAEVEGYVNRVVTPNASFELIGPNGVQTVTWTAGTTAFTGGTGADIARGIKIEVEGTRKVGGALAATKIAIRRASNVLFETTVTNPQPSSLTLFGITVAVNSLTQYKDSSSVRPEDVRAGEHPRRRLAGRVGIPRQYDAPASIVATRVERIDPITFDRHILQGPVGAKANPTLTILGVTVTTTAGGTTFLQADEYPVPGGHGGGTAERLLRCGHAGANDRESAGQVPPGGILANEVQVEPTLDN